jgi:hypothetical protein
MLLWAYWLCWVCYMGFSTFNLIRTASCFQINETQYL